MDSHWIFMAAVWAFVEIVQRLRKKGSRSMRTGAIWALVVGFFALIGSIRKDLFDANPWLAYGTALAMNGIVVGFVYGLRVMIGKGWARFRRREPAQG